MVVRANAKTAFKRICPKNESTLRFFRENRQGPGSVSAKHNSIQSNAHYIHTETWTYTLVVRM